MKYISKSVLLGVFSMLLLATVSCTDKLDTQEGQLNTGDLDYTNTDEMIAPVIGAYYNFADRGWEEPLLLGVRGDDVNAGGLGDQQPFADTDRFNYTKDYWMYNSLWNIHYSDIINMNTAILQVGRFQEFADAEESELADQYISEIRVLRAWFHLNLARTFEDVFIITSNQPEAEVEGGPASKEEVMQWISAEMDTAVTHLPDLRPNERTDIPGGVTKYTAYAIQALANLELENYQAVADATGAIISSGKFSLYPDFYQLFKKPGELSDESLLEMQYSDFGDPTGDVVYHLYAPFGPQGWTPERENAESGWGFYEPSIKFIEFMLDRNETVRLETSVLFTDRGLAEIEADGYTIPDFVSNETPSGDIINDYARALFASGKHYLPSVQLTPQRNQYGAGKNMIVIRYAEVLLMYAEALTRGATATSNLSAADAVNLVRERAGLTALSDVTSEQVMDEKFAELAMEWGIRYYDMIRLDNYEELSYDGRSFSAADEYLPYPQAQVDALPLEATDVEENSVMNDALRQLN